MKKVLLIAPPFERFMGYSRFYYHIGLASLAAVLDQNGFDVMVYDADYDVNGNMLNAEELMERHHCYEDEVEDESHPIWKEVVEVVRQFQPDTIGVSVLSVTLPSARFMIRLLRKLCPNAVIFTGGVHATLCPEDLLDISDYVITNEGEAVIVDVINGKYERGLVCGSRILDLDSLPFPAVNKLYKVNRYQKRDLSIVMSTRGCPNACKFCNSFDLWRCKTTRKSVDYFIRELKHLMEEYGIRDFFITDDSFTFDWAWLNVFLDRIAELSVTWRCFSNVSVIREDMVDKMIASGCRNIKLGIESGSQRMLNQINKGIQLEDIRRVDEILRRKKLKWSAYFIIGFPNETVEDIRETQKLIRSISADSVTVSIYTPLPKNRLCAVTADYKKHSFHSPNNNFTGMIPDDLFRQLVQETLHIAGENRSYNEHIDK